jgi:hypothetical protein
MRAIPVAALLLLAAGTGRARDGHADTGHAGEPRSLSGAWLYGDFQPEPRAAVVRLPPRCWSGGVDFTLADRGKKLTATVHWVAATQGMPPTSYHDESETLTGTHEGDHVLLTGEHVVASMPYAYPSEPGGPLSKTKTAVRYDLHIDQRNGHLVGERDGQPFWLARFTRRPGACGSPPP